MIDSITPKVKRNDRLVFGTSNLLSLDAKYSAFYHSFICTVDFALLSFILIG